MANKIQLRRGTKAQLTASGPLAVGEPGYTTDTRELVIGNGAGANTPVVTATSADITYYVRTDGNDNNTGLANTAAGAFKTIGKAVSMIPCVVNHAVRIQVAAGTYAESPKLSGFSGGGYVGVYGSGVVNVTSMIIERCQRTQIFGITFTSTTTEAVFVYDGGFAQFLNCVFTASSAFSAINISYQDSRIEACTFSNRDTAIQVSGGQCYVVECTGTNNTGAILPAEGAVVKTAGTIHAGIIHTGFNGIVNPWGDNTTTNRSISCGIRSSGPQSLAAYNWVTIAMESTLNTKNEYNQSTGVFTASQPGLYRVSIRVHIPDLAAGATAVMRGIYNWTTVLRLDLRINNLAGASEVVLIGNTAFLMNAGDVLAVQVNTSSNSTMSSGGGLSSFDIVREA